MKYEIDVHIRATHGNISYTKVGWNLAKMFDEMIMPCKKGLPTKIRRL